MIISRTPLRISLGGGGTDLESYYKVNGGSFLSAAIDKYVYIGINRTFTDDYFIKYSMLERVAHRKDIQHPIIREAFDFLDVGPSIELVSMADIPSGTGLGSSGSFTVGLIRALSAFRLEHMSASRLAEIACHIEIDRLGEPIGKQDQFIAAHGGLTCFEIDTSGRVTVEPLAISRSTLHDLELNLVLFFTGYVRSSSSILEDQSRKSNTGDLEMLKNLDETRQLGQLIRKSLEENRPEDFGSFMNEHWQRKRRRSSGMSNQRIDELYELGMNNGAIGGKLVGAGSGGFLMFYAKDHDQLRRAFHNKGLEEVVFRFDYEGSTILARS